MLEYLTIFSWSSAFLFCRFRYIWRNNFMNTARESSYIEGKSIDNDVLNLWSQYTVPSAECTILIIHCLQNLWKLDNFPILYPGSGRILSTRKQAAQIKCSEHLISGDFLFHVIESKSHGTEHLNPGVFLINLHCILSKSNLLFLQNNQNSMWTLGLSCGL